MISVLTYDAISALQCCTKFHLTDSLNMLDNFYVVYSITKTLSKVACMQAISTAFSIIFCPKCTEHRLLLTGINAILISVDVVSINTFFCPSKISIWKKIWLRFSVHFKCILNKIYLLISSLKPQNAVTKQELKKLPSLNSLTGKEISQGIKL